MYGLGRVDGKHTYRAISASVGFGTASPAAAAARRSCFMSCAAFEARKNTMVALAFCEMVFFSGRRDANPCASKNMSLGGYTVEKRTTEGSRH
jgi:hypothetical protein